MVPIKSVFTSLFPPLLCSFSFYFRHKNSLKLANLKSCLVYSQTDSTFSHKPIDLLLKGKLNDIPRLTHFNQSIIALFNWLRWHSQLKLSHRFSFIAAHRYAKPLPLSLALLCFAIYSRWSVKIKSNNHLISDPSKTVTKLRRGRGRCRRSDRRRG